MSRRLISSIFYGIKANVIGVSLTNKLTCNLPLVVSAKRCIHLTPASRDLMEFFDDKDNWNKNEIRVGRSWRKEELRIKSNEDLHKLWYVLLKERNMLLTMEYEYNMKHELFPNPERLDKVKESMLNLEGVVRERDRAYFELETGETGERPAHMERNRLGMPFFYKAYEHVLPEQSNLGYRKKRELDFNRKEVANFHLLLNEKRWNERRKERVRERNQVMHLLKRFPDIDLDVLKEKYPSVDVDRVRRWKKAQGHFVPT